jgi:hypothetical protein
LFAGYLPESKEGRKNFDELEAVCNFVETQGILGEKDGHYYANLDKNQFS